ncbi:MAG TPA: DUF1440 domain-containing protein [Tepidisphaeraceae bacterium]|nr:DUF1440 domain-containing protein [Tepidisphaeraceae bacterium]
MTRSSNVAIRKDQVLKGLAAGGIGGLVAAWIMGQFQSLWSKLSQRYKEDPQASSPSQEQRESQQNGQDEAATVKTAVAVSEIILHHEPTPREKQVAGPLVHYVYGTLIGGAYGMLAETKPVITIGAGTGYGTVAWLLGDEMMVPLLRLSKPPTQYPLSTHIYALASHLVYGLSLEGVRRAVRSAM